MLVEYEVRNTETNDLDFIFGLFANSIVYQEKHGYPVWRNYDKRVIVNDIENKNQYKVIIDSKIAIVFSICYNDKVIWRDLDRGESIYLHRIVVNPEFKGQKLFGVILDWAVLQCTKNALKHIRMDTWAANRTIADYYKSFGFSFVENYTTPDSADLPVHNRNLALTLLEYKIGEGDA